MENSGCQRLTIKRADYKGGTWYFLRWWDFLYLDCGGGCQNW